MCTFCDILPTLELSWVIYSAFKLLTLANKEIILQNQQHF